MFISHLDGYVDLSSFVIEISRYIRPTYLAIASAGDGDKFVRWLTDAPIMSTVWFLNASDRRYCLE